MVLDSAERCNRVHASTAYLPKISPLVVYPPPLHLHHHPPPHFRSALGCGSQFPPPYTAVSKGRGGVSEWRSHERPGLRHRVVGFPVVLYAWSGGHEQCRYKQDVKHRVQIPRPKRARRQAGPRYKAKQRLDADGDRDDLAVEVLVVGFQE
jgi:hypothetical protein